MTYFLHFFQTIAGVLGFKKESPIQRTPSPICTNWPRYVRWNEIHTVTPVQSPQPVGGNLFLILNNFYLGFS